MSESQGYVCSSTFGNCPEAKVLIQPTQYPSSPFEPLPPHLPAVSVLHSAVVVYHRHASYHHASCLPTVPHPALTSYWPSLLDHYSVSSAVPPLLTSSFSLSLGGDPSLCLVQYWKDKIHLYISIATSRRASSLFFDKIIFFLSFS